MRRRALFRALSAVLATGPGLVSNAVADEEQAFEMTFSNQAEAVPDVVCQGLEVTQHGAGEANQGLGSFVWASQECVNIVSGAADAEVRAEKGHFRITLDDGSGSLCGTFSAPGRTSEAVMTNTFRPNPTWSVTGGIGRLLAAAGGGGGHVVVTMTEMSVKGTLTGELRIDGDARACPGDWVATGGNPAS